MQRRRKGCSSSVSYSKHTAKVFVMPAGRFLKPDKHLWLYIHNAASLVLLEGIMASISANSKRFDASAVLISRRWQHIHTHYENICVQSVFMCVQNVFRVSVLGCVCHGQAGVNEWFL